MKTTALPGNRYLNMNVARTQPISMKMGLKSNMIRPPTASLVTARFGMPIATQRGSTTIMNASSTSSMPIKYPILGNEGMM